MSTCDSSSFHYYVHFCYQFNGLYTKGSFLRCHLPRLGDPNENISWMNCATGRKHKRPHFSSILVKPKKAQMESVLLLNGGVTLIHNCTLNRTLFSTLAHYLTRLISVFCCYVNSHISYK